MPKVKALLVAIVLLLNVFLAGFSQPVQTTASGRWPSLEEIEGKSWLVLDSQTGQTLVSHAPDLAAFPASTTKIMTAILILEANQLDLVATVSATAVKLPAGSSKIGFLAGEQVTIRDALAAMMLASGNDAANVLAESYAGSLAAFADAMNQKAAELGMTGSHFSNPSGLHDPTHVMTARDMAILAAYAMKNPQFRELVGTCSYSMPATNKHPYPGWGMINNTNRFLQFGNSALKSDWLDHYEGVKTGSTDAAGNNLVAAAVTKSGHELVSVIFGVPLSSKIGNPFIYSRTLLEFAAQAIPTPTPAATTAITSSASLTAVSSAASAASSGQLEQLINEHPWRTAFLILLPIALLSLVLAGLAILYIRRYRIRPKRIRPK